MMTRILLTVVLAVFCASSVWFPIDAGARGSRNSQSSEEYSFDEEDSSTHRASKRRSDIQRDTDDERDANVDRDSRGRIKRSASAKNRFKKENPCPSTGGSSGPCPGYVIDHVVPLKRGGKDSPENMQWQTEEAAKAKDKIE